MTHNQKSSLPVLRQKIEKFADLPNNWNSYQAKAPSPEAIKIALKVFDHAQNLGIQPDLVSPTSDSGIFLQFTHHGTVFKWEIESDSDIGVMVQLPDSKPEFFDLTEDKIEAFIVSMHTNPKDIGSRRVTPS